MNRWRCRTHKKLESSINPYIQTSEAQAELQKITEKARSDGERRTALFGQMIVAIDSGKLDQALAEVDKQYALGEKSNDVPARRRICN